MKAAPPPWLVGSIQCLPWPRFQRELRPMPFRRLAAVTALFFAIAVHADDALTAKRDLPTKSFTPDPSSVERFGPAFRYPQAGWTVVHIEGEPYERGVQYGRLMAAEIVEYLGTIAAQYGPKAPTDAYRQLRVFADALFLRRYDAELLEEMKGIADGANAAGAKFDSRALDLVDMVVLNSEIEIAFLDAAVVATPTGLEGKTFKEPQYDKPAVKRRDHCSAFAATGPATRDGKIVFGHITMWGLLQASRFNVWLDVKPAKGRRVAMQTYPGGIMSGMDYYMSEAGILLAETTVEQTPFNPAGESLASRCRRAVQYGECIDDVVRILSTNNNGLYTNLWLIGDTKTNEIAMLELGTNVQKVWRSGKKEWLAGAEGFYWGCNNTKDLQVRLEAKGDLAGRPASAVFRPSERDVKWLELYRKHKGNIDATFGHQAFSTAPLAAASSLDAKLTTADMAKEMKTFATYGPRRADLWEPKPLQVERNGDVVRSIVGNDWTVLDFRRPLVTTSDAPVAVDLGPSWSRLRSSGPGDASKPAWKGTLIPRTNGDVWLATAFAEYERIVSLEKSLTPPDPKNPTSQEAAARLALAHFGPRSRYMTAVRRLGRDVPLKDFEPSYEQSDANDVVTNKGVLLLAHLRKRIGADQFDAAMTEFGAANAGKQATVEEFQTTLEKHAGRPLGEDYIRWLNKSGLPNDPGGPVWGTASFMAEPDKAVIVVGTKGDVAGNRAAAKRLQFNIKWSWSNYDVPIVEDRNAGSMLRDRHVLVVGRPETNLIAAQWLDRWPVRFGAMSFDLNGKRYANAGTGVVAATDNPNSNRFSAVLFAGLSADATYRLIDRGGPQRRNEPAEIILVEADRPALPLMVRSKPGETPVARAKR
jgi:hypothetical protein